MRYINKLIYLFLKTIIIAQMSMSSNGGEGTFITQSILCWAHILACDNGSTFTNIKTLMSNNC